jgi:hypothetical protein
MKIRPSVVAAPLPLIAADLFVVLTDPIVSRRAEGVFDSSLLYIYLLAALLFGLGLAQRFRIARPVAYLCAATIFAVLSLPSLLAYRLLFEGPEVRSEGLAAWHLSSDWILVVPVFFWLWAPYVSFELFVWISGRKKMP